MEVVRGTRQYDHVKGGGRSGSVSLESGRHPFWSQWRSSRLRISEWRRRESNPRNTPAPPQAFRREDASPGEALKDSPKIPLL